VTVRSYVLWDITLCGPAKFKRFFGVLPHKREFFELERIWKEVVVGYWGYDPDICLEKLRKITKTVRPYSRCPSEIRG
jgi:hypothetical protein